MAGRFSIEATFKAVDGMSKVIGKIEGRTKSFAGGLSKDFDGLGGRFRKVAGELGDLAKKAAIAGAAIGTAVGAGLYNAGKVGADFEQAMANVGAVSLMTRDEVKDLEQAALKFGATTKFSATEVAGGMELMGKAGFTNKQILEGIGPILSAAAAEGAEFGEVAGHVSNLLKGMGLETDQAGRVADVLTLASARTNSSISSLGESMANVSSTARQFKIPLEQAVASVALLQDVGIDASTAGTAVNTMLTNMANPSKEAQASMKALGISFQDAHGDMLPLTQVFEQFSKASQKSGGNMKQVAFFSDLVGLRGQKAALNLEKLFAEGKFGDLVKELDGAAGSAKKMADLRMDTLTGDLTKLSNTADTLKIGLFDMESGPLRGVVQGVTKWIDANRGLIGSGIESAIATLTPIVRDIASAFVEGFTAVMPAVKSFATFMFNDFGSKADWMVTLKRAAQIVGGLTVAAIGAAAVFGGVLAAAFAEVVELASDVVNGWNWMVDGIGNVLFAVDDFFANLGAKWRAFRFADLANYLIDGLVNGITNGAQSVADAVTGVGQKALDALKSIWDSHSPAVKFTIEGGNAADGIVNGIMGGIPKAVAASETMAGKVLGAMAIKSPEVDTSSLGNVGAKVPPYAVGYDQWPPRAAWMGSEARAGDTSSTGDAPSTTPVPQVIAPTDTALRETISRQYSESRSTAHVVISPEKGTKAEVKKAGKGVTVAPSGGV